jgi:drug/metabolite transporter (DMT)-like permease
MGESRPARWLIVLAFAAVFLIWGSSYIAIRFAVETLPPILMPGVRFTIAGALLIGWTRARGAPAPTRKQWRDAAIAGALLFLINNSLLTWSQANGLPSGLAAVIIGSTPMFVVLFQWLGGGTRPSVIMIGGIALSTVGIVALINPAGALQAQQFNPLLGLCPLIAAATWAAGSLYARGAELPKNALLSTGMQLFSGGVLLLLFSVVSGDAARLDIGSVSLKSLLATVHLGFFASIIGFSAFVWLMRTVTPAQVMTYAYVNPVVAVFLGWLLAGETLTVETLLAAALSIAGVFVIVAQQSSRNTDRQTLKHLATEKQQKHAEDALSSPFSGHTRFWRSRKLAPTADGRSEKFNAHDRS